jgi:hypothetical protein
MPRRVVRELLGQVPGIPLSLGSIQNSWEEASEAVAEPCTELFRISDTIKLERKRVDLETGKLHIRIMKTRRPMYAGLPASVMETLRALPDESPYFFWSGKESGTPGEILATATHTDSGNFCNRTPEKWSDPSHCSTACGTQKHTDHREALRTVRARISTRDR